MNKPKLHLTYYRRMMFNACQDLYIESGLLEVCDVLCDVVLSRACDSDMIKVVKLYKKLIKDSRKASRPAFPGLLPILKTRGKKITKKDKRL